MSRKFIIGSSIALAIILIWGISFYFLNQASADTAVTKDFCNGAKGAAYTLCVKNAGVLRTEMAKRDSARFKQTLRNMDNLRNFVPSAATVSTSPALKLSTSPTTSPSTTISVSPTVTAAITPIITQTVSTCDWSKIKIDFGADNGVPVISTTTSPKYAILTGKLTFDTALPKSCFEKVGFIYNNTLTDQGINPLVNASPVCAADSSVYYSIDATDKFNADGSFSNNFLGNCINKMHFFSIWAKGTNGITYYKGGYNPSVPASATNVTQSFNRFAF
jgi:hypothetical protein